jgi:hypothetical protein
MSQSIDASRRSIGELLGTSERRPVILPAFQRPYSWEKTQVATFWGDLIAFLEKFRRRPIDSSYFLGPVVILDDPTRVIILDGQQRLATSTILLASIRNLARALGGGVQQGADFARDLQRDVIEKSDNPLTYALTLGDLDEPFFVTAVKVDPAGVVTPTLRSHLLIQGAADYFREQLGTLVESKTPTASLALLKEVKDAVTKAISLVAITVKNEEDAYDIFESLNDRGLRLSVPDLVVNLLLRRCPDDPSRHTVRLKWNTVVQELGKRDISRFLRHLWISRFGDLKARGLYTEIKDHLQEEKITSLQFAEMCAGEANTYVGLIEKTLGMSKQAKRNLKGLLDNLGVNNALPLLLSGYRSLNASDFEKLLNAAIAIYIRHTLIANQNPLDLETAFYDAAREIRAQYTSKVSSAKILAAAKRILVAINPADDLVEAKASELVLSRSEASWFMAEVAAAMQSKTKEVAPDKANIEHIFPQNAEAAEWPARDKLEPYIWHIGNLTVLGKRINMKARNKAFADKCVENYSKSEIMMTQDLTRLPAAWDEAAIKARATRLAKTIAQLWK